MYFIMPLYIDLPSETFLGYYSINSFKEMIKIVAFCNFKLQASYVMHMKEYMILIPKFEI